MPIGKGKQRTTKTQHLVKWREYGDEWNQWMNHAQLDNAKELVEHSKQRNSNVIPEKACPNAYAI
jgi:hypothetical protein